GGGVLHEDVMDRPLHAAAAADLAPHVGWPDVAWTFPALRRGRCDRDLHVHLHRAHLDARAGRRVDRVRRTVEGRRTLPHLRPADLADTDGTPARDDDDAHLGVLGLDNEPPALGD